MRFSVFTPTHDPSYLQQAYQSLLAQTYTDWEWVILPNNGVTDDIKYQFTDPRVRVLPHVTSDKIGELKNIACMACKGFYLVELDHDDMLVPKALEEIYLALGKNDPGFLYSDSAHFYGDGTCQVFGKEHGWEHYNATIDGRCYTVNKSFDLTPASLSQIFFAPDHVRVWNAALYRAIGGHNKDMRVCDDQDLMCRTYLATGVPFTYIPKCLYLYRMRTDGNNSYLQRNAEIQKTQQTVANQYIYPIIEEWCKRERTEMLDLGGAFGKPANFKSVDILPNADYIVHLPVQRLPFPDSSIGCIRASDFLEHVPHCRNSGCSHFECTVGLMNELYRVLVPGGWLISSTPSTDGRGAWQDPTHVSGWNSNSFWYYTRRQQAQYVPGIKARFQGTRVWNDFPSDWHKQHNIPYVYADLVALKGQRQPGIVEI